MTSGQKTAYTPGPWKYERHWQTGEDIVWLNGSAGYTLVDACDYRDSVDARGGKVNPADARLIAAAPELLRACRAALVSVIGDEHFQEFRPLIDTLKTAIAKATGEEGPA